MTEIKPYFEGQPIEPVEETRVYVRKEELKYLELYREIGTIPQLRALKEEADKYFLKYKEYSEIGTIERFRELTEKAEPKKPILIGYRKDGEAVHECGCCGAALTYADQPFCMNCSCKVDWE